VVQVLDEEKIEYMLTGSVVSSLQGEPRSTHDIDLIVSIQKTSVDRLVTAFPPPDFYLDESSVRTAVENKGMFNLLNLKEGDKVDFWILTQEEFDQSRFSRRQTEIILGARIYVSSPEDTILAKLRWADLSGGSEKQFVDALRVYEVQYQKLDIEYITRWVRALGLETSWKRLIAEAEPTG
jgi:hypothetical protein